MGIEFGRSVMLHSVEVFHASAAGRPTTENTRRFVLETRGSHGGPWAPLAAVDNDAASAGNRVNVDPATPVNALRLRVLEADQVGGSTARIADLRAWGWTTPRLDLLGSY